MITYKTERAEVSAPNHVSCMDYLLARLAETTGAVDCGALCHRAVHGGEPHTKPQLVTYDTMDELL